MAIWNQSVLWPTSPPPKIPRWLLFFLAHYVIFFLLNVMHLLITNIILHFWVKGNFLLTLVGRRNGNNYLERWFKLSCFHLFFPLSLPKFWNDVLRRLWGQTDTSYLCYLLLVVSFFFFLIYSWKNNSFLVHAVESSRMRNMCCTWENGMWKTMY